MKILLYGTDNVKIFEKLVEIKQKYKKEQTYELTGEVGVDDLRQYLQGLSMFGSDELICFQVSKKTARRSGAYLPQLPPCTLG